MSFKILITTVANVTDRKPAVATTVINCETLTEANRAFNLICEQHVVAEVVAAIRRTNPNKKITITYH